MAFISCKFRMKNILKKVKNMFGGNFFFVCVFKGRICVSCPDIINKSKIIV